MACSSLNIGIRIQAICLVDSNSHPIIVTDDPVEMQANFPQSLEVNYPLVTGCSAVFSGVWIARFAFEPSVRCAPLHSLSVLEALLPTWQIHTLASNPPTALANSFWMGVMFASGSGKSPLLGLTFGSEEVSVL